MHDRALAPRSRRRSQSTALVVGSPGIAPGAAEEEVADHVGIPRILGRRARWVTSRLRQR